MARKNNKTERPKWTEIVLSALAILSFVINGFQYLDARSLNRRNQSLETTNRELDNTLKSLHLAEKRSELGVRLEARYLITTGQGIYNFLSSQGLYRPDPEGAPAEKPDTSILLNSKVLKDLETYISDMEELGQEMHLPQPEEPEDDSSQSQVRHGLVLYRVKNMGRVDAQKLVLVVRWKDFPTGDPSNFDISKHKGQKLWMLDTSKWDTQEIHLADLSAGQEVIVPLAHVVGTNTYFGRVVIPEKFQWYNPVIQQMEEQPAGKMVPADEWLYRTELGGTDIYAQ